MMIREGTSPWITRKESRNGVVVTILWTAEDDLGFGFWREKTRQVTISTSFPPKNKKHVITTLMYCIGRRTWRLNKCMSRISTSFTGFTGHSESPYTGNKRTVIYHRDWQNATMPGVGWCYIIALLALPFFLLLDVAGRCWNGSLFAFCKTCWKKMKPPYSSAVCRDTSWQWWFSLPFIFS